MSLGWLIPVEDRDIAECPGLRAVVDDYVERGFLTYSVYRCRYEWVMVPLEAQSNSGQTPKA